MGSTYGEAVLDFDLNFLSPTSIINTQDESKFDRQRTATLIVKKKLIKTSLLIKKYYLQKDELDVAEKKLLAAKEECKQICIDYGKSMDACTALENSMKILKNNNKEIAEKFFHMESQVDGLKSHINQLQALIKQRDTEKQALNAENKSLKADYKTAKSNAKIFEKKFTLTEQKNEILLEDISLAISIIFGKVKLNNDHKTTLKKYNKCKINDVNENNDGTLNGLESDEDLDFQDSSSLPYYEEKEEIIHIDFEEILMSPDTTTSIKPSNATNVNKTQNNRNVTNVYKPQLVDAATSTDYKYIDNCQNTDICGLDQLVGLITKESNKAVMIDHGVDPIVIYDTKEKASSPIRHLHVNVNKSPIKVHKDVLKYIDSCQNTDICGIDQLVGLITEKADRPAMIDIGVDPILLNKTEKASSPIKLYSEGIKCKEGRQNTDISGLEEHYLSTKESNSTPIVDRCVSPIVSHETIENSNSPESLNETDVMPIVLNEIIENVNSSERLNETAVSSIVLENSNVSESLKETDASSIVLNETIENSNSSVSLNESSVRFDEELLKCTDNDHNTTICASNQNDDLITKEPNSSVITNHDLSLVSMSQTEENASSSISPLSLDISTSPLPLDEINQNVSPQCDASLQLKDCLEINSSTNLCKENDNEIQVIFSKMRMDYELITPLPMTPKKTKHVEKKQNPSLTSNPYEHFICPDAAKVDKRCKKGMSELAKDIDIIKSFLRIQFPQFNQIEKNVKVHQKSLTDNSMLNITNPKIIVTSDLLCSEDCEPNEILNKEVSIGSKTQEIKDKQSSQSQTSPNSANSSSDTEYTNVDRSYPGTANELVKSNVLDAQSLTNNTEITKSNKVKTNGPLVVCEKLNLNDVSSKVCDTEENCRSQNVYRKTGKLKKISKLGKLRRQILPKYKIKIDDSPRIKVNRSHVNLKPLNLTEKKKVPTELDTSATLNDKHIYQKAVEVMAALKSKQKSVPTHNIVTRRSPIKYNKQIKESEGRNKINKSVEEDNNKDILGSLSPSSTDSITTRSRSKYNAQNKSNTVSDNDLEQDDIFLSELCKRNNTSKKAKSIFCEPRKRPNSSEIRIEVPSKRVLRSSVNNNKGSKLDETIPQQANKSKASEKCIDFSSKSNNNKQTSPQQAIKSKVLDKNIHSSSKNENNKTPLIIENKNELDKKTQKNRKNAPMENLEVDRILMEYEKNTSNTVSNDTNIHPKESLLCIMIAKYGVKSVKYRVNKVTESVIESTAKKIEEIIGHIIKLPHYETKDAMNKFIEIIKNWNMKQFLSGFIKYLQSSERKLELYKTMESPPAPPMTKSEQILLYIIAQLNDVWDPVNVIDKILCSIEYTIFSLNRTPEFDVIESMSHFYAVVCRYFKLKSRLRLFILDAMYCVQYKSIVIIKQCLKVWAHILPLAHMGIAKNPLVTCLVYLLHFYKCEDRNNNVRDVRILLQRNYFYKFTDWNEAFLLDMMRNAIKELKDIPIEKKMLRMALIILAKRQGPKWSQNNIIKKLIQPIMDDKKTPEMLKEFCVSLIGPLMRPYPIDMKVHCEVVMNQLISKLENNPTPSMAEAIITSLIYMNRHNQNLVIQTMLMWRPRKLSEECEEIVRGFVKSKSIKAWKAILSKMSV